MRSGKRLIQNLVSFVLLFSILGLPMAMPDSARAAGSVSQVLVDLERTSRTETGVTASYN